MTKETDRELLSLAARAIGCGVWTDAYGRLYSGTSRAEGSRWNPLIDDGDALRLAVQLCLQINPNERCVCTHTSPDPLLIDPCAAVRRAIVQAASKIGKGMK